MFIIYVVRFKKYKYHPQSYIYTVFCESLFLAFKNIFK